MDPLEATPDLNGRDMERGDTVTTIAGDTTGKIKDIVCDDGAVFVEVRPLHKSTGKGIWHASDRLLRLSGERKSK